MPGPQHYSAAEVLLGLSAAHQREGHTETAAILAAQAQVHATLALAAATVLAAVPGTDLPGQQYGQWKHTLLPATKDAA